MSCEDAMDWDLGTHGIQISFIDSGKHYEATYLPWVAISQGWDKRETVLNLMRKPGWNDEVRSMQASSSSNDIKPWSQVTDFRISKFLCSNQCVSFAEWQKWRDWVLLLGDKSEDILNGTYSAV